MRQRKMPNPIVSEKELSSLTAITERYNKLCEPKLVAKAGRKVAALIPEQVKQVAANIKAGITEQEVFNQAMTILADGFKVIEENAAKASVSEKGVITSINKSYPKSELEDFDEICLMRSYRLAKVVSNYKKKDLLLAFSEGAATGTFGFAGLPFNLVLSTFIFYRAVQSVAMFYGYDVKNDSSEAVIAGEVLINAMSPGSKGSDEVSGIICKIMAMTELTAVKQTAKKTWADMVARGGLPLLLAQMRALANKAAQKAIENAGQKGLEKSIFKNVFEQIGKKLTKKAIGGAVPIVGAAVGGLFDISQMNTILEYADVFYNKRFIVEKEVRVNRYFFGDKDDIIDITVSDVD